MHDLRQVYDLLSQLRENERGVSISDGNEAERKRIDPIVNAVLKLVTHAQELKGIRPQLIAASKQVNEAKLSKEDRQKFRSRIDDAFKQLELRERKEEGDNKNKQAVAYDEAKRIVAEATQYLGVASDLREAKSKLIAAQTHLKQANLSREQRDELFKRISSGFEILNRKLAAERNQQDLHAQVAYRELSDKANDLSSRTQYATSDFGSIRAELAALKKAVLEVRAMPKDKKDELIRRIDSIFEALGKRQAAQKAQRDREYQERKAQQNRDYEVRKAEQAQKQREFEARKAQQEAQKAERQRQHEQKQREYEARKLQQEQQQREYQARKERETRERAEKQRRAQAERERNNKNNKRR